MFGREKEQGKDIGEEGKLGFNDFYSLRSEPLTPTCFRTFLVEVVGVVVVLQPSSIPGYCHLGGVTTSQDPQCGPHSITVCLRLTRYSLL